jgi:hypothetical protein
LQLANFAGGGVSEWLEMEAEELMAYYALLPPPPK